jgi:hypothetical protein
MNKLFTRSESGFFVVYKKSQFIKDEVNENYTLVSSIYDGTLFRHGMREFWKEELLALVDEENYSLINATRTVEICTEEFLS